MFVGRVKGIKKKIRTSRDVASAMHRTLMRSPGHKKNILNYDFKIVGIGVKRRGRGYYCTELFHG